MKQRKKPKRAYTSMRRLQRAVNAMTRAVPGRDKGLAATIVAGKTIVQQFDPAYRLGALSAILTVLLATIAAEIKAESK